MRSTSTGINVHDIEPRFIGSRLRIRPIRETDFDTLGGVLFRAYVNGPEQEEATIEEGSAEVARCTGGEYGPFMLNVSFVAVDSHDTPVGATLMTRLDGVPLVAHAVVEPAFRGFGVGSMLLQATTDVLKAIAEPYVHLAVSSRNPAAARLYLRLGFTPLVDGAIGAWITNENLNTVRTNLTATMPEYARPGSYGVLLELADGGKCETHWNADNTHGLPSLVLAFLLDCPTGDASVEMTRADLDAAVLMLSPAAACQEWDHPNLASWRMIQRTLDEMLIPLGQAAPKGKIVAEFRKEPSAKFTRLT